MSLSTDFTPLHAEPTKPGPPAASAPAGPEEFVEAKAVISKAKATLRNQRKETLTIPVDPRITQWKKTNFDQFAEILSFFGLPDSIETARDRHAAKALAILRHIDKCENELGALDLDIRRHSITPAKAAADARKIVQECSVFQEMVQEWRGHIKLLVEADRALRKNLSIAGLLPFTKNLKKINVQLVEAGYDFYHMVKDNGCKSRGPNLQDYQNQAVALEKKLKSIDLNGFSGLPQAILEHQIQVALAAIDQVKEFIEGFQKNLPGEFASIDKLEQDLTALRTQPANDILKKIADLTQALARNMIDLRHRAKTLKRLRLLPVVIQEVKALHNAMQASIIPQMRQALITQGSPINPYSLAAEKTADFFMGLKGFVRAVKLLFNSIGGQRVIKSEDLQARIVDVLNTCEVYYGNTKMDITKLKNFIDDKLSDFERPFPYEGLFQTMKESIMAYGSLFEKALYNIDVPLEYGASEDSEGLDANEQGMKLGRLIAKLEVRTANLESSQS